ncbi:MAG TPA: replication-associated recombination protein A [Thermotogota bacterium]|nr:replication-associated recombination protein A [Thermotogota bacterium]NLZ13063.1 replication-associated recombination protein A [Thermotogaceae bacterium]HNR63390.1 replication-associated recombination protein A [Thermotogota bacterium]HNT95313.1 replication-associated recombination protein A [Thermotogota bacterium]HOZ11553.1 replication-associated recombination protein A [Thermotogota bacterium]
MAQKPLWEQSDDVPLAHRIRPRTLDEVLGQEHLFSQESVLRKAIENDQLFSAIFYGPPGCGKTTVGGIIKEKTHHPFVHFSAARSTMSQLKPILEEAAKRFALSKQSTVIFVDEIHRFNRLQQDVLLPYIESGEIVFVGATTENPSFEINPALLSRCKIFTFQELSKQAIAKIFIKGKEALDPDQEFTVEEEALNVLVDWSSGDARTILNYAEVLFYGMRKAGITVLSHATIEQFLQKSTAKYRKHGDEHFDLISAFIKSMRGSDPDAVVYYLTRMLESGEDPLYVARRIVRFASEDIGLADPQAMGVAVSCFQAVHFIGLPECTTSLAQAAVYMAIAPKSNRIYLAYDSAKKEVARNPDLPVPFRLRNAVTPFMKESGYGKDYHYPHDSESGFVLEPYLPESLQEQRFYVPSFIGKEKKIREYLETIWKRVYPK